MKNTSLSTKKKYSKPALKQLGSVSKITQKIGSQTDFGTGKYEI